MVLIGVLLLHYSLDNVLLNGVAACLQTKASQLGVLVMDYVDQEKDGAARVSTCMIACDVSWRRWHHCFHHPLCPPA
jgi:hypothetical protein